MTKRSAEPVEATRTEKSGAKGMGSETRGGGRNAGLRTLVVHPYAKTRAAGAPSGAETGAGVRLPAAALEEIVGLTAAIHLDVAHSEALAVARRHPGTFFGKGTVERLNAAIKGRDIEIAVIDTQLTPIQQRNLERDWDCKVLDRTGIILEIFGERARTREGRMQVELAHQTYQRSRLVRSWTHLERQRGGAGFMGGPGERQIETDRRLIDQRITRLKKDLKAVKRTRDLHRKSRRDVPYPIIALVGYTNAGKSTLFNTITKATVEARDQLFATLDPTLRALETPAGGRVIVSDTVGFISELPHELVEAFHATLEEVLEADIIVHVRDCAHPDSDIQKADVLKVLGQLGLDEARLAQSLVEVLNKADLLDENERTRLANMAARDAVPTVLVSAISGEGTEALLKLVDEHMARSQSLIDVNVAPSDGKLLSWLYDHGEVVERSDDETHVHLKVRLSPANVARLERLRA